MQEQDRLRQLMKYQPISRRQPYTFLIHIFFFLAANSILRNGAKLICTKIFIVIHILRLINSMSFILFPSLQINRHQTLMNNEFSAHYMSGIQNECSFTSNDLLRQHAEWYANNSI